MKKFITLAFILFFSMHFYAQENENVQLIHEVKLDGAKLALGGIIEGSYEYVGSESSGYGVSVLLNPRGSDTYFEKFSVSPFYRMYFFNKEDYGAKGLFVEGFTKFSFGSNDLYFDNNPDENYFDTALGIAVGKKWVNKGGFVLEIFLGGGRTLGLSDHSPDGFFRGGIFVGKRF